MDDAVGTRPQDHLHPVQPDSYCPSRGHSTTDHSPDTQRSFLGWQYVGPATNQSEARNGPFLGDTADRPLPNQRPEYNGQSEQWILQPISAEYPQATPHINIGSRKHQETVCNLQFVQCVLYSSNQRGNQPITPLRFRRNLHRQQDLDWPTRQRSSQLATLRWPTSSWCECKDRKSKLRGGANRRSYQHAPPPTKWNKMLFSSVV
jgi:hypothetical protein